MWQPGRWSRACRIAFAAVTFVAAVLGSVPSGVRALPCEIPLPFRDEEASRILAEERPFQLTNPDRFFTYQNLAWKDAAPLEDPDGPPPGELETREALERFLARRYPCAPERVQEGLAIYGDPIARDKVPEPTLRAALAALVGTVGEPAIAWLLYRTPVSQIAFGVYVEQDVGFPGRVAGASVSPDGTRDITIDLRYRGLPFGAFSALLVHEALHAGADDDNAGWAEETAAISIEALVYMEMLLIDPSLARLPDELTRGTNNRTALVRLNSGPPGTDRLTLFVPGSDVNVDPLATEPLTEFSEYYARYSAPDEPGWRERETTGNWLLWRVMERLAAPGDTETPGGEARFDAATLAFIDANQAVLTPAELVAVACILELDVSCG